MTAAVAVEAPGVKKDLNAIELWHSIDWVKAEDDVRRLRQRIFKAAQDDDLNKVRNLQKLMLRSRSNLVVSIRRVTQRSMGRRTPGIDGFTALRDAERGALLRQLSDKPRFNALPVRRVHIPKKNGKMRPLGIPTMRDRVEQARVKNALEPEWEARFEGRSYGFRPGRGCHDAIERIFKTVSRKDSRRSWVLDADLSSAFDRINHDRLLEAIGDFPARREIEGWLKAGVMEHGRFAPTEDGTPQGGVISPLLLNIALHGMGTASGDSPDLTEEQRRWRGSPFLIRYADDFVVLCTTREEALKIKANLTAWLAPRGLAFNDEKSKIVHIDEGFDFLGFTVRRYDGKLLIKPSKEAVARVKAKVREIVKEMATATTGDVIRRLNPLIKGWTTYYCHAVSSETFNGLDNWMYWRMMRWAKRRHPMKSTDWIVHTYFGRFNPTRTDKWVFGDKETGAHLRKFSWTKIRRHVMVKGSASKDDPELSAYWAERTRKGTYPQADRQLNVYLAARQKGLCPLCGLDLIEGIVYEPDSVREWAEWFLANARTVNAHHLTYRSRGGSDHQSNRVLIHSDCHRKHHGSTDGASRDSSSARPSGPLEPDAMRVARPVLRGASA